MNYEEILENLREGKPFSFARFGDGEVNAILGHCNGPGHVNCDGHEYFPDMGERLRQILSSRPTYTIGVQNLVKETRADDPRFWELYPWNDCPDGDVLHKASIHGELGKFFTAISKREVLFVGNADFTEMFPNIVTIPTVNCWKEYKRINEEVYHRMTDVVLYAASMMSEVLIDDFAEYYNITQIDVGSVFDPYVGKITRGYHKNLTIR